MLLVKLPFPHHYIRWNLYSNYKEMFTYDTSLTIPIIRRN